MIASKARKTGGVVAALWSVAGLPAWAQITPHAGVEIVIDDRRRGISWSDGRAAPAAWGRVDTAAGFDLGVRVTGTRGDPRHGGADAVIEPTLGWSRSLGGFRVDGFVTGHLFAGGQGGMNYGEGGVAASYSLGPAEVGATARYAPPQGAIGGDDLYLGANARIGIPATPYTVTGAIGRSSGNARDGDPRALRLRPGGTYADWSVGVERITGPLTLGVAYSDTDIDIRIPTSAYQAARHTGAKVAFRAAVGF